MSQIESMVFVPLAVINETTNMSLLVRWK